MSLGDGFRDSKGKITLPTLLYFTFGQHRGNVECRSFQACGTHRTPLRRKEVDVTKSPTDFGSRRVAALDGLRGIAALMVFFVHSTFSEGASGYSGYRFPFLQPYFYSGSLGVELFFVISAFCLYGTYSNLIRRNPRTAALAFWIKRSCRIMPLWWIWVGIYAYWHNQSLRTFLGSALFFDGFQRYLPNHEVFPGQWSLFVEETFYLLFPLMFFFIRKTSRTIAGAAFLAIVAAIWTHYSPSWGVSDANEYIAYSPLTHWYCFLLGMWCYQVLDNEVLRQQLSEWSSRYGRVAMLVFMAGWLHWHDNSYAGADLVFVALVLVSCCGTNVVARIVSWKPLQWMGRRCYSMYLCHFFVLDFFPRYTINPWSERLGVPPWVELRLLIWSPVVLPAVLLLSSLTYYLCESPSIRLGTWLNAKLNAAWPPARQPT